MEVVAANDDHGVMSEDTHAESLQSIVDSPRCRVQDRSHTPRKRQGWPVRIAGWLTVLLLRGMNKRSLSMNRNKRCGAFYTFGRVVGLACVLIVASAAQAGGNQPPATAAQPTAPQVLKAIYGKDSHGESNFDIDQG